jgi:hypothetical protein
MRASRYPNLGVIALRVGHTFEANRLAHPGARRCNFDAPGCPSDGFQHSITVVAVVVGISGLVHHAAARSGWGLTPVALAKRHGVHNAKRRMIEGDAGLILIAPPHTSGGSGSNRWRLFMLDLAFRDFHPADDTRFACDLPRRRLPVGGKEIAAYVASTNVLTEISSYTKCSARQE